MKAVIIQRRHGGPDALTLQDVPKPTPKPNELLVRIYAASINDWDSGLVHNSSLIDRIVGRLVSPNISILGCDIAGRVEEVGEAVTTFRPGDEVYGDLCENGFGAFAEYVCVPATTVARKPAQMTFEQAAAIPQAGMLAVQGLIDVGQLRSDQKLLLNGGGGGVGTFALQLSKLYNNVEVTVVDKPGKFDMLRALGADHFIDYQKEDFTKGDKRYDLILDVKTNRSPFAYLRALKPGGTYATVGGSIPRLLQVAFLGPIISRLYKKHVRLVALKANKDLAFMNEQFEAGTLRPVIDRTYRLSELSEAFRRFGTGEHKGKILVNMM